MKVVDKKYCFKNLRLIFDYVKIVFNI